MTIYGRGWGWGMSWWAWWWWYIYTCSSESEWVRVLAAGCPFSLFLLFTRRASAAVLLWSFFPSSTAFDEPCTAAVPVHSLPVLSTVYITLLVYRSTVCSHPRRSIPCLFLFFLQSFISIEWIMEKRRCSAESKLKVLSVFDCTNSQWASGLCWFVPCIKDAVSAAAVVSSAFVCLLLLLLHLWKWQTTLSLPHLTFSSLSLSFLPSLLPNWRNLRGVVAYATGVDTADVVLFLFPFFLSFFLSPPPLASPF